MQAWKAWEEALNVEIVQQTTHTHPLMMHESLALKHTNTSQSKLLSGPGRALTGLSSLPFSLGVLTAWYFDKHQHTRIFDL